MEANRPRVLLIGEIPHGHSLLEKRLRERGCECEFATTSEEAEAALAAREFDVVLSPMKLRGRSLFSLAAELEDSRTTLFYSCAVEDGCWWLPAVRAGRRCFGTSALRPSEFVSALYQTIEAMQAEEAARWAA
jgi:CheY-like chemotaxis protein